MLCYLIIALIIFGNLIYAYQCIFQTRKYIEKYGFGEGSAIMTRLVGTFAAGYAVTLIVALFSSIEGAWLLFVYGFVQACIGAVVCFQTIHSHWGSVDGVKTSAEGCYCNSIFELNGACFRLGRFVQDLTSHKNTNVACRPDGMVI